MKGIASMYDHKWKKGGMIISAIGLILMISERLKGFVILKKLNATQHYALFEWVMLFGLAIVIYSKEKYDDDRAKMIRLKSFHIAFLVMVGTMMAFGLTCSMHPEEATPPGIFLMMSAIGIILYLLVFHIGLYFDFLWDYEDRGVWENLKNIQKNKWGMLAYLVVSAVILVILTLLQ